MVAVAVIFVIVSEKINKTARRAVIVDVVRTARPAYGAMHIRCVVYVVVNMSRAVFR